MTFVPSDHEHAPKVAATPARQGRWGRHVLWVLLASTFLAALALFGAWSMRSGDLQRADGKEGVTFQEAQASGNTAPAPVRQDTSDNDKGTFGAADTAPRK